MFDLFYKACRAFPDDQWINTLTVFTMVMVESPSPLQVPQCGPQVCILQCESSYRQIPCVAVTKAACGTHSPRATRLKLIEITDDMKPYAQVTYIKARSCLVNWCAILMFRACNAIWFGVQNECSYLPCDVPWYEK